MIRQARAALRDISDDIRTRPGRAGLSFLALSIGMTSLTVLLSVLGGLKERARQIVEEMGAQVFAVTQPEAGADQPRLSTRHLALLAAQLPDCRTTGMKVYNNISAGGDRQVRVMAVDAALLEVRPWQLVEGRFFDGYDLANRERSLVAPESLARDWGWRLGDIIQLAETPFRLVGLLRIGTGVLESESSDSTLLPGDRAVFVPHTVPPYWLRSRGAPEPGLDAIYIRAGLERRMEEVLDTVRTLLAQPDHRLEQLSFLTPAVLLQRLRKLQDTIRFTAGSIAMLCLALGGTTLMSLLIANVRERVTEIGLRRALGASALDVAGLFVLEAVLLTGSAALVGAIGTTAALWLARDQFPVPLRLDAGMLLAPLLVATALGAASSFWPARAAARISPAEALRNE